MPQNVPKTMKAAAIDRFGGVDAIQVKSLKVPEVGPDEVLIRVESAGVAVWGVQSWRSTGSSSDLAFGVIFLVAGFALAVYGLRVRRKLHDLSPDD